MMGPLFDSILTILCLCSTAVHIALQCCDDILHYTVDTLYLYSVDIGILFTANTAKITIAATNAADWMMQAAPPLRKLRKTPRIPAARVSGRCAGGGLGQRTPCRAPNPRPPAVAGAAVHCSATVLWSGDRTIPELLNLYIDTVFVLLPPSPC